MKSKSQSQSSNSLRENAEAEGLEEAEEVGEDVVGGGGGAQALWRRQEQTRTATRRALAERTRYQPEGSSVTYNVAGHARAVNEEARTCRTVTPLLCTWDSDWRSRMPCAVIPCSRVKNISGSSLEDRQTPYSCTSAGGERSMEAAAAAAAAEGTNSTRRWPCLQPETTHRALKSLRFSERTTASSLRARTTGTLSMWAAAHALNAAPSSMSRVRRSSRRDCALGRTDVMMRT